MQKWSYGPKNAVYKYSSTRSVQSHCARTEWDAQIRRVKYFEDPPVRAQCTSVHTEDSRPRGPRVPPRLRPRPWPIWTDPGRSSASDLRRARLKCNCERRGPSERRPRYCRRLLANLSMAEKNIRRLDRVNHTRACKLSDVFIGIFHK